MIDHYVRLLAALKTGVAVKISLAPGDATPKALRVGLDIAMVDHGALVQLLIDKGLFTVDEYEGHLVKKMSDEIAHYEAWLSSHTGANVKLG